MGDKTSPPFLLQQATCHGHICVDSGMEQKPQKEGRLANAHVHFCPEVTEDFKVMQKYSFYFLDLELLLYPQ